MPASTILGVLVANDRLYLQSVSNAGANDVAYASLGNGFDAIFSAVGITLA